MAAIIGPGGTIYGSQKWSSPDQLSQGGPFTAAIIGPGGPFTAAKNGPGPFLAAVNGPPGPV